MKNKLKANSRVGTVFCLVSLLILASFHARAAEQPAGTSLKFEDFLGDYTIDYSNCAVHKTGTITVEKLAKDEGFKFVFFDGDDFGVRCFSVQKGKHLKIEGDHLLCTAKKEERYEHIRFGLMTGEKGFCKSGRNEKGSTHIRPYDKDKKQMCYDVQHSNYMDPKESKAWKGGACTTMTSSKVGDVRILMPPDEGSGSGGAN